MQHHTFSIPDGYKIEELQLHCDIDDAVALLSGRGGTRITVAYRQESNRATLVKHRLVCPHCRSVVPAYPRYMQEHFKNCTPVSAKVSRRTVEAWGGAQSTWWEDADETLILNQVYTPREPYTCPKCSLESTPARGSIPVSISNERKKVTISCCTTDVGELFRVPWKSNRITALAFPFHESVVFNFKTGRVFIVLSDNNNNQLAVRNITAPADWSGSKIYRLLSDNTLVRRKIVQCFQTHWPVQIPFVVKDLTPDILVKLVAYVGYPAFFYSRIPSVDEEYRAEKSFHRADKIMHTAQAYQHAILTSQTPWAKSVRKLLFSFPDYGFYLSEIELLSKLLPNTDSLRAVFGRSFTYSLLSFLHQHKYVNIEPFFVDYLRLKGAKNLLTKLEQRHYEVMLYALRYSCLSPAAQTSERQKWKTDRHILCLPKERYALPMRCNTKIPDIRIGGFQFAQLKCRAEYVDASNQLNNCLKSWETSYNPVFVIRGKRILGAIEVDDNGHIIQARGKDNAELPEICAPAYEQWKAKFHLTEQAFTPTFDDDDDGPTPFTGSYLPFMFF